MNELIANNIQLKNLNEIKFIHTILSKDNLYKNLDSNFYAYLDFAKTFYNKTEFEIFNKMLIQMKQDILDKLEQVKEEKRKKIINEKATIAIEILDKRQPLS